jgi:hypothetical protein
MTWGLFGLKDSYYYAHNPGSTLGRDPSLRSLPRVGHCQSRVLLEDVVAVAAAFASYIRVHKTR